MRTPAGFRKSFRSLFLSAFLIASLTVFVSASEKGGYGAGNMSGADSPVLHEKAGIREMTEYARLYHPDIQAARQRAIAAGSRIVPAGTLPDPSLNYTQNLRDINSQRVSVTQGLPMWGKRGLASSAARNEALAYEADLIQTERKTLAALKRAHAEHAYILAAIEISREQIGLIKNLEESVRARYKTGQASMSALLRIQAEGDKQTAELNILEDLKGASAARLNAALGRSADSPLPAIESLESISQSSFIPPGVNDISDLNPGIWAMIHRLEALEKKRALAGREGYPDLMLGLEVERRKPADKTEYMYGAMAGINIPLWRGSYKARRDEAAAEYKALQHAVTQRKNEIEAEAGILSWRLREARSNSELYGEVLTVRARQALASAASGYRNGTVDFSELIETQRELPRYRLSYLRALADILIYSAELEELLGTAKEDSNEQN